MKLQQDSKNIKVILAVFSQKLSSNVNEDIKT